MHPEVVLPIRVCIVAVGTGVTLTERDLDTVWFCRLRQMLVVLPDPQIVGFSICLVAPVEGSLSKCGLVNSNHSCLQRSKVLQGPESIGTLQGN